jgi:hypothetical protein
MPLTIFYATIQLFDVPAIQPAAQAPNRRKEK